jgi:hypothetical protein
VYAGRWRHGNGERLNGAPWGPIEPTCKAPRERQPGSHSSATIVRYSDPVAHEHTPYGTGSVLHSRPTPKYKFYYSTVHVHCMHGKIDATWSPCCDLWMPLLRWWNCVCMVTDSRWTLICSGWESVILDVETSYSLAVDMTKQSCVCAMSTVIPQLFF